MINKNIILFSLLISLGAFLSNAVSAADPNSFNRLMVTKDKRNPPLDKDGIHDPQSPGIAVLQAPKEAFGKLEKSGYGDYVNWIDSYNKKHISPRYDLKDPKVMPKPLDLKIVMEVKGSTPDVIFPHVAHTQILDCANCHPDLFVPKKGENPMSMAEIILGKKCGLCHGTIAFPVGDCLRCHSKKTKNDSKSNKKKTSKK